jgi:hypothetical protein
MGYDIVHRLVEALTSTSSSPFNGHLPLFFMKGVERTTRPGPFEGNSAFYFNFNFEKKNNNVEPARPGPLNVNDIFVIFCNKINNNNNNKEIIINSNSFATLEQDVAPGLARGFATQVEVETELGSRKALSPSSSVKRHLQALGAFLYSALPSRPTLLPSSWPSVEVSSWATTTTLPSALAGVNIAMFAAQVVGSGLLYAVYLWAMKDSLPAPQAPAPVLTLRRFVSASRRRHNAAGQTAAVAVPQAPVVVAQQPAAAAAAFQAAVVVAMSQQATAAVAGVLQAAVVLSMTRQAAAAEAAEASEAAARERDAHLRAHIAQLAWLEEVLYTPPPEQPEGMDMCIWISMRRLEEERSLAEATYAWHRFLDEQRKH